MTDADILIVDDDADVAYAAKLLLKRQATRVATLAHPGLLDDFLARTTPRVVLLDLNFTPGRTDGAEGLAALSKLRAMAVPPTVIALTAYADVPLAVEALKRGAADFVTKPWDNAKLLAAVTNALSDTQDDASLCTASPLIGESSVMRELRALIARIAPTDASVMILGENGVGKELVAHAIHHASKRATQTFLAVDVGSLPESTFESELFGHRRGAFTDARHDRAGRFQAANRGTLFLDEVGNLSMASQAKLLTALERRQVTPVGADKSEHVDVRVLSATNLDEAQLFNPQVFRPDLLFRLNTIVVRVPPLRERREDIAQLTRHYLTAYAQQYARQPSSPPPEVLSALTTHDWPGNVRALRNACERAVILNDGQGYRLQDFGLAVDVGRPMIAATAPNAPTALLNLDARERDAIVDALDRSSGNVSQAAKLLGLSRAALYRRLEKHGL